METAAEIKEKVRQKLKQKKVVIFGYKDPGKWIAETWGEEINLAGFVTNCLEHPEEIEIQGKSYPLMDLHEIQKGDYFIIVGVYPVSRRHICNLLSAVNWEPFEDYIWDNWMEIFLRNKKYLFLAGVCQVATVYYYLSAMKTVTDQYVITVQSTHLIPSKDAQNYWRHIARICDVYICGKHDPADTRFFQPDELNPDCKKITIPRLFTRLYWPQSQLGRETVRNEYFMRTRGYVEQQPHGPFETGDENINRLLDEGKTTEEIVQILTDENFYSSKQVEAHYDREMEIIRLEDQNCDLTFSEYFNENWKQRILYKDPVHLSTEMNWWLVGEIMKLLELPIDEIALQKENPATETVKRLYHHCTVIPVYPSVAKHLGLQDMITKDTKYDVTFYHGMECLTFEEYIRRYVEICGKIRELKEQW